MPGYLVNTRACCTLAYRRDTLNVFQIADREGVSQCDILDSSECAAKDPAVVRKAVQCSGTVFKYGAPGRYRDLLQNAIDSPISFRTLNTASRFWVIS